MVLNPSLLPIHAAPGDKAVAQPGPVAPQGLCVGARRDQKQGVRLGSDAEFEAPRLGAEPDGGV